MARASRRASQRRLHANETTRQGAAHTLRPSSQPRVVDDAEGRAMRNGGSQDVRWRLGAARVHGRRVADVAAMRGSCSGRELRRSHSTGVGTRLLALSRRAPAGVEFDACSFRVSSRSSTSAFSSIVTVGARLAAQNSGMPIGRPRRAPELVVSSEVHRLTSPSSRGLGRGPFKAKTRVRIPLGTPFFPRHLENVQALARLLIARGRRRSARLTRTDRDRALQVSA